MLSICVACADQTILRFCAVVQESMQGAVQVIQPSSSNHNIHVQLARSPWVQPMEDLVRSPAHGVQVHGQRNLHQRLSVPFHKISWEGWQSSSPAAEGIAQPAQASPQPKQSSSARLETITEGVPGNLWRVNEQTDWTRVNPTASFIRHATDMGHPIQPHFVQSRTPPTTLAALPIQPTMSNVRQVMDYIEKLQFELQSCELWSHMIQQNIAKELHKAQGVLHRLLSGMEVAKESPISMWGKPMEEDS